MIRWASLIASSDGTIDYVRVRSLAGVVLAFAGGIVAIWVVFIARNINETLVGMVIAALVLPLTGGKVADALSGRSLSPKIQAGEAPGRRNSDSTPAPP